MDRALASGAKGCRFDSCWGRQPNSRQVKDLAFSFFRRRTPQDGFYGNFYDKSRRLAAEFSVSPLSRCTPGLGSRWCRMEVRQCDAETEFRVASSSTTAATGGASNYRARKNSARCLWSPAAAMDWRMALPRRRERFSPDISSVFSGFQWREGLSAGIEGFVQFLDPTRKAIRNDRV